jgi:dolichol kinase
VLQIKQNTSVILVIADAMAAIIGRRFGKPSHIIPHTNNKTLEGFIGFVVTFIAIQLILSIIFSLAYPISFEDLDVWFVLVSGVACGIGELYSGDMDNVMIGMVYVGCDYVYQSGYRWGY